MPVHRRGRRNPRSTVIIDAVRNPRATVDMCILGVLEPARVTIDGRRIVWVSIVPGDVRVCVRCGEVDHVERECAGFRTVLCRDGVGCRRRDRGCLDAHQGSELRNLDVIDQQVATEGRRVLVRRNRENTAIITLAQNPAVWVSEPTSPPYVAAADLVSELDAI